MNQDGGQGAERTEWILETFWRKNGQNFVLPKWLFWTFLPRLQVPWGGGASPSFLCLWCRLLHSQS